MQTYFSSNTGINQNPSRILSQVPRLSNRSQKLNFCIPVLFTLNYYVIENDIENETTQITGVPLDKNEAGNRYLPTKIIKIICCIS